MAEIAEVRVPLVLLPQFKRRSAILSQWAYHTAILSGPVPLLRSVIKRPATFVFRGRPYRYFYHPYNRTWANERTVEIPLAYSVLSRFERDAKRALEVGNVLLHYLAGTHYVVDKYERPAVGAKTDILSFEPKLNFDLIVSVSTLEHLGIDEPELPYEPDRAVSAISYLTNLLADGGCLWFTVPLGFNPEIDRWVRQHAHALHIGFLRRIDRANRWAECLAEEALSTRYATPFPDGNAIAVVELFKGAPGFSVPSQG